MGDILTARHGWSEGIEGQGRNFPVAKSHWGWPTAGKVDISREHRLNIATAEWQQGGGSRPGMEGLGEMVLSVKRLMHISG